MAQAEERKRLLSESKKSNGADLSQVIKGMQHAVNEAQKTLESHHLNSFLSFFHSTGEPKMESLHINGDKYIIDVPTESTILFAMGKPLRSLLQTAVLEELSRQTAQYQSPFLLKGSLN